jgi:hypothetical protein
MKAKKHPYSADTNDRRLVHVYFAITGILLSYCIYLICETLRCTIPWWIDAPAILGFYGTIYIIFKKWLWNNSFFKFLLSLKTPDWNGTYNCILKTSFDNFHDEKKIDIIIVQDWDTISITSRTNLSKSNSISGSFSIDNAIYPVFTYEYINQPDNDAPSSMQIHIGMTSIWFENGELIGEFFTGRGRVTYGKFTTEIVEKKSL